MNKQFDPVNQPEHYTAGKYECIDVMEDVFGTEVVKNFCKCNAFKYLWRSEKKNGIQDIKKAIWYLNHLVELEPTNDDNENPFNF